MKQPKPWYWDKRKAWYVTIGGKQVKLAETEKEANKEFYRLMASEGRLTERQVAKMTVADACEAVIGANSHARESTQRLYRDMLGPFAAEFQHRRLDAMTPDLCIRFVTGYEGRHYKGRTFGDSSRALMFRYIKTLFKWSKETGLIATNPLYSTPNPWKIRTREEPLSEDDYLKLMADRKLNDNFKEVLEVIWRTGIRPGEVAKMSARHLDAHRSIIRFQPTEHKTGTKTGLQREVFCPDDLMVKLRAYAVKRPRGPLLLNRRGKPWTIDLMAGSFRRAKKRLGLPGVLVLYTTRHGFITRLVESGVPLARVAKLSGHTHPETVMKHYYHPETQTMLDDVTKIGEGDAEKLAAIQEQVKEERKKKRSSLK